jgi:hypothetical protein
MSKKYVVLSITTIIAILISIIFYLNNSKSTGPVAYYCHDFDEYARCVSINNLEGCYGYYDYKAGGIKSGIVIPVENNDPNVISISNATCEGFGSRGDYKFNSSGNYIR